MISVRRATLDDVAGVARVHVAAWHETYPGMLPESAIASATVAQREAQWRALLPRDDVALFVADDDGTIVGFAGGGPNREPDGMHPGELWAMYLLQAHHKRRVGRALFEAVRAWLRERDLKPFLCWVLADNPACAFYERVGGRRFVTQPTEVRGADVVESGYEWA